MKYKLIVAALLAFSMTATANNKEKLQTSLSKVAANIEIESTKKTPIDGLTEVVVNNGLAKAVYYMSNDAKYFINGQIIEIDTRKDLTSDTKSAIRLEALAKVKEETRINFFPEEMKYKITVFTDIDCGYCRKLHMDMDAYNDLGIGISYLFYPRAGIDSSSFNKAVSVWCSEDQSLAMNEAQNGFMIDSKSCENPVKDQYYTGVSIGVNGTPNIITESGNLIPSYLPPEALLERLKKIEASNP